MNNNYKNILEMIKTKEIKKNAQVFFEEYKKFMNLSVDKNNFSEIIISAYNEVKGICAKHFDYLIDSCNEDCEFIKLTSDMIKTINILLEPNVIDGVKCFKDKSIVEAFEVVCIQHVADFYSKRLGKQYEVNYCPTNWAVKDAVIGCVTKNDDWYTSNLINIQVKTDSSFGIQKMKSYGKKMSDFGTENLLFVSLHKFNIHPKVERKLYIDYNIRCLFFDDLLKNVWNYFLSSDGKEFKQSLKTFEYFVEKCA